MDRQRQVVALVSELYWQPQVRNGLATGYPDNVV